MRANSRFIQKDWRGAHHDAAERLEIYENCIEHLVQEISDCLGDMINDMSLWEQMKRKYLSLIHAKSDFELAKTFYNSITRRIFATEGVNPRLEFGDMDFDVPDDQEYPCPVCKTNILRGNLSRLIEDVLDNYRSEFTFHDLKDTVSKITGVLCRHFDFADEHLLDQCFLAQETTIKPLPSKVLGIEMIETVFYRNKAAYLIGRIYVGSSLVPIVLALLNTEAGLHLDAVLIKEEELSVLFSYTRSYFRVKIESAYELTRFLKTIMPRKRLSEIYTALGYHKHGKAELYREIQRHLKDSSDLFATAPGKKGMVMIVFTLASFNVVFKVIRDKFDYPKNTTRNSVMKHYDLVFNHDRAGRLIDAQAFEHLKFPKQRFTDDLLEGLLALAPRSVRIEGEDVIIRHLYTERRVKPLDLYIRKNDAETAAAAIIDYGQAIKDLASTNIFPGDLFLKNFGVTRLGRVVFYDYDEICFLSECNFRNIPQSRDYDDEMQNTPWFMVGEDDVFPEEFKRFMGLSPPLMEVFEKHHGDLFETDFWIKMQKRIRNGEILDIFPYPASRRLGIGC